MRSTRPAIFLFSLFLLTACTSGKKQEQQKEKNLVSKEQPVRDNSGYRELIPSIVKIESFDNGRFLNSETAFFIDSNIIACRLTPLIDATGARIIPWNESTPYPISGFVAVDRINDFLLLKVEGIQRQGIPLFDGNAPRDAKTIYLTKPQSNTLPLHKGQVTGYGTAGGSMRYHVTNSFYSQSYGIPVFISPDKCIGIGYAEVIDYENQNMVIPSSLILDLLKKKQTPPQPLGNLKTAHSKAVSEANSKIKGLLIETDMGNVQIRLFNETPEYRDNFISLVRENYYDSLLIHRVIKGFGIQSGAADTRYAGKDDIVGWKGPGYTLPAHLVPGLYHKRGMIGSPRKPDKKNSKYRSDGSQFYLVTGRTYSDTELNDIEKETGFHFSAQQRQVYKTIGGAPHLDGTYTIFGEVTGGMDVADKISQVPANSDFRPLKNIRIRKISVTK